MAFQIREERAVITRYSYIRRSPLIRKPRRYVVPPEILAYWDWVRKQPCICCPSREGRTMRGIMWQQSPTEVAHVGSRGVGQKSSGWEVLPLCKFHHRRGFPLSHHTLGKRFWSFHGLDRYRLIRELRERYFGLTGQKAALGSGGFDREGL